MCRGVSVEQDEGGEQKGGGGDMAVFIFEKKRLQVKDQLFD